MQTFGFMTLHLMNEHAYVTGIAQAAIPYGVTCYRFVPTSIVPTTERIVGQQYDPHQEAWVDAEFPIPSVIYDRCFYSHDAHSKRSRQIVQWLKQKRDVHFLGYGLPNKMDLYNELSKTKLQPYLLPSTLVSSPLQVISTLDVINPAVMKPVDGSGGNGIYFLRKELGQYTVETDKKNGHMRREFETKESLQLWLQGLLKKRTFLLQAYKQLTTKHGEPFDLRSLLQKDAKGCFQLVGNGIRVGAKGAFVSNLSAGGRVMNFADWLEESGLSSNSFLLKEIDYILSLLPTVLEEAFPPLFEIGVDVGVAKDGSLWILDVNSKPGRKVILTTAEEKRADLYVAPILYALHLFKLERSVPHEEIISN